MDASDTPDPSLIADAAAASAGATADAVERAAEVNQDPEVAAILQDASLKANTTASRVGWLRSWFSRIFHRH